VRSGRTLRRRVRHTDRTTRSGVGAQSYRPVLALVVVSILARLGYWLAGVRFDASPRADYIQYVDPVVLDSSPVESVWNLHMQPPAFNAFLWLAEDVSPLGLAATGRVTYLGLGIALTLCAWALALELGVPRRLAFLTAVVVSVNPATILYENWLYPTFPVAVLTLGATLAAARFVGTSSRPALGLFFGACAALVYTRSVFHRCGSSRSAASSRCGSRAPGRATPGRSSWRSRSRPCSSGGWPRRTW
jgi:hypothetical protein